MLIMIQIAYVGMYVCLYICMWTTVSVSFACIELKFVMRSSRPLGMVCRFRLFQNSKLKQYNKRFRLHFFFKHFYLKIYEFNYQHIIVVHFTSKITLILTSCALPATPFLHSETNGGDRYITIQKTLLVAQS